MSSVLERPRRALPDTLRIRVSRLRCAVVPVLWGRDVSTAMTLPPKPPMLTPEQQAALDALPPKRREFVLALVGEANGNQTAAARIAGYREAERTGSRLVRFAGVKAAVEAFRRHSDEKKVAGIAELRERLTLIVRGEDEDFGPKERIKAFELLGKSQAMFVERREVEHHGQAPTLAIQIVATPDEVDRFLGSGGKGGKSDE